jgi:zinc protease
MQNEAASEQELQRAKNQVEASYLFGQDSTFRQAMLLGQAETVGAGWRHVDAYLEKLRNVTAEDVRRVARRYFVEDARTVGILVPTPPSQEAAVSSAQPLSSGPERGR